ncbi:preprotein translocase subunit SecG [Candidatus Ishikawella capsulata]|uniref:Protein-export membrane protein SecG n=1 Tax=Candidatus Ishikawaella capsulata Mpkobe TaxID=476281 RepID=C5WCT9_9ENTR|nr:preprotein translocase subunit SecG [Candidatus Ishikawaella capsulata]BAH83145.1 protein-export membrane protein [Candidatus Ishikawaella capsulata Mpkobe]
MYQACLIIFFITSILLITIILLQSGKGADIGWSGAIVSSKLFNSPSSSNFMMLITVLLAILFFLISIILNNHNMLKKSTWENLSDKKVETRQSVQK